MRSGSANNRFLDDGSFHQVADILNTMGERNADFFIGGDEGGVMMKMMRGKQQFVRGGGGGGGGVGGCRPSPPYWRGGSGGGGGGMMMRPGPPRLFEHQHMGSMGGGGLCGSPVRFRGPPPRGYPGGGGRERIEMIIGRGGGGFLPRCSPTRFRGPPPVEEMWPEKGRKQVWAETEAGGGKVYYYNVESRQTTWERPKGPNVGIVKHEEWTQMQRQQMQQRLSGTDKGHEEEEHGEREVGSTADSGGQHPYPFGPSVEGSAPAPAQQQSAENQEHQQSQSPASGHLQQFQPETQQQPQMPVFIGGFSPVGCPMGIPGFNAPPPGAFIPGGAPQYTTMLPPPWAAALSMLCGVPPPILQQIDPNLIMMASEWSEHLSPDGRPYFYNAKTQKSVWHKPQPLVDLEQTKTAYMIAAAAQQQQATAAAAASAIPLRPQMEHSIIRNVSGDGGGKGKDGSADNHQIVAMAVAQPEKKVVEKWRPVSSTSVANTSWRVVWTGDRRVFFYNILTKQSIWERPQALVGRLEVDELTRTCPLDEKGGGKVKKVEATCTTSPVLKGKVGSTTEDGQQHGRRVSTEEELTPPGTWLVANPPPTKKSKREFSQEEGSLKEVVLAKKEEESRPPTPNDMVMIETDEGLKEMSAAEVEGKAANQRSSIPLETRLAQFKEMLMEKEVSAFSPWEKELHKIVYEPRYVLLTSKERKQAFEAFVKERAESERAEKRMKQRESRAHFFTFLKDVNVSPKMSFDEFTKKFGRDERYKLIEKPRDREFYYWDYIHECKSKEKKDLKDAALRKEQVRDAFVAMLREKVSDYQMKWSEVKRLCEGDPRLSGLKSFEERESEFKFFTRELKVKEKEKKRAAVGAEKKQGSGQGQEKENKGKAAHGADKVVEEGGVNEKKEQKTGENAKDEEEVVVRADKEEGKGSSDSPILLLGNCNSTKRPTPTTVTVEGEPPTKKKIEECVLKDSESEEGCISDDDEEAAYAEQRQSEDKQLTAQKEKRARAAEESIREREKELQRSLALQLRDRAKERDLYKHQEAIAQFQALLTDLVRNIELNWKETKALLKEDRRWETVNGLPSTQMEELYQKHCENIANKKKQRFRELLDDCHVQLDTNWKEVRKLIKDDPRFLKFSSSERRCELEFELYLLDMHCAMGNEFCELLKETKSLNWRTKEQLKDSPSALRNIESLLAKDKRFLRMHSMEKERDRLLIVLMEYLEELEKKGPPPPPTSSRSAVNNKVPPPSSGAGGGGATSGLVPPSRRIQ